MSYKKKIVCLVFAAAVMLTIHFLPTPKALTIEGIDVELSVEAKSSIAVMVFAILLWLSEAIAFAVTALSIFILLPALGVCSLKEVTEVGFGNSIIIFVLGVLLLSSAFTRSGLGKRTANLMLAKFGTRPGQVILGFLITGTFLSMWLSNMAAAAILLPVAVGILKSIGAKPLESNFGRGLMISCCWGPAFGGIATPAGAGPNPMIIAMMKDMAGIELTFAKWMVLGIPAAILMLPFGWLIIMKMFPPEIKTLPISVEDIEKELDDIGPISAKERKTLVIFLMTVFLWMFGPLIKSMTGGAVDLSISGVALLCGIVMFLPGIEVLNWKQAQEDIDWGGTILVMGGVGLGLMLYQTGAARWLSLVMLGKIGTMSPVIRVFVVTLIVLFIKVLFTSNTITGVIMIPILIGLSKDFGIDPWLLVAPAALATSISVILVSSAPTNVIPYSAGYFSVKDMAKSGIILSIVCAFCITVSVIVMGTITGIYKL